MQNLRMGTADGNGQLGLSDHDHEGDPAEDNMVKTVRVPRQR